MLNLISPKAIQIAYLPCLHCDRAVWKRGRARQAQASLCSPVNLNPAWSMPWSFYTPSPPKLKEAGPARQRCHTGTTWVAFIKTELRASAVLPLFLFPNRSCNWARLTVLWLQYPQPQFFNIFASTFFHPPFPQIPHIVSWISDNVGDITCCCFY